MILDTIFNRFHLRFKDRESAGNILGEAVKDLVKKEDRKNSIVLGVPRGGVIIADSIARKLSCDFDIIIPRKLRAPYNREIAIGAIMGDGTTYLNEILVKALDITSDYITKEKLEQLKEIERRKSLYFSDKKIFCGRDNIELDKRIVLLADDGTASGATFIAAIRYIKSARHIPKIILATPIAPRSTVTLLRSEGADHVEVLTSPPDSVFKSVEQYYQSFPQVTDQEVIEIMKRWHNPKS